MLPHCTLLRLRLRDRNGLLLSENTYWRYRTARDMQALNEMARTTVSVDPAAVRP